MGNTFLNKPGGPLYDPGRQAVTKAWFKPKPPNTPDAPIPVAPAEPNNAASMQEMQAERMNQARRKSLNQTIFSGNSGGYSPAAAGASPNLGSTATRTG